MQIILIQLAEPTKMLMLKEASYPSKQQAVSTLKWKEFIEVHANV